MNKLRPVALVAVLAIASLPFLLGGWLPSWYDPSRLQTESVSRSFAALLFDLGPAVFPVVLLTILATGLTSGLRGLRAASLFLLGSKQAVSLEAHRALTGAARVAIGAGLFFSLIAMLALLATTSNNNDGVSPALIARFLTIVMISPLSGIVLGRLVLAPAAAAAAIQANAPELARRSMTAELALFALIVPVSVLFFVMVVS